MWDAFSTSSIYACTYRLYGFFLSFFLLRGPYGGQLGWVMRHKKKDPKVFSTKNFYLFFFSWQEKKSTYRRDSGLIFFGGCVCMSRCTCCVYIHTSKYPHGLKQWNLFWWKRRCRLGLKSNSTCILFLALSDFRPVIYPRVAACLLVADKLFVCAAHSLSSSYCVCCL
jgi:hypothetical protein